MIGLSLDRLNPTTQPPDKLKQADFGLKQPHILFRRPDAMVIDAMIRKGMAKDESRISLVVENRSTTVLSDRLNGMKVVGLSSMDEKMRQLSGMQRFNLKEIYEVDDEFVRSTFPGDHD